MIIFTRNTPRLFYNDNVLNIVFGNRNWFLSNTIMPDIRRINLFLLNGSVCPQLQPYNASLDIMNTVNKVLNTVDVAEPPDTYCLPLFIYHEGNTRLDLEKNVYIGRSIKVSKIINSRQENIVYKKIICYSTDLGGIINLKKQ